MDVRQMVWYPKKQNITTFPLFSKIKLLICYLMLVALSNKMNSYIYCFSNIHQTENKNVIWRFCLWQQGFDPEIDLCRSMTLSIIVELSACQLTSHTNCTMHMPMNNSILYFICQTTLTLTLSQWLLISLVVVWLQISICKCVCLCVHQT